MQRIFVTGNAGSGKTSVAGALAIALDLPYVCLDSIVWQAGWVKTPGPERREKELHIAQRPSWIVDGVSELFLQAADTVIFLDIPRRRCLYRVLLRNLPYLFRSRPGLPERCPEILIVPTLLRIIWKFPGALAPGILAESRRGGKRFLHVRNQSELEAALKIIEPPALVSTHG
jgi:adenylate kinase family enzyme